MDPIHLNFASEEDLLSLPGVGGPSAKSILQFLKTRKTITSLVELQSCAPHIDIARFQLLHADGSWTSEIQEFIGVGREEKDDAGPDAEAEGVLDAGGVGSTED
ncbi:MAG: hypothetical protein AAFY26_25255, partial [Cyanobacteria bacterium J06638_22]